MFNGHLDVVSPGNTDLWKFEPFSGDLINGRIFGRGSSDMKGGLAAMLLAFKALTESNIKLNGDLFLTAVSDEEVNGTGVKELIKRGFRTDMAVIGEPTDLIPLRAHKGLIWFEIKTYGVSKHSSFATSTLNRESNAIFHMAKILESIQKYHIKLEKKNDDLVGRPTLNVGTINGGSKTNVIPDTCSITVDRRILPDESPKLAESELRKILENLEKQNPNLKTHLEVILSRRGSVISENESIVKIAKESVEEVLGRPVQTSGCPATSDMETFVNEAKIPTILLGPGRLAETHMVDEFIEVDQVMKAIKIYSLIILKALL
jgi:succinyl-diaminopimelate desuccinylase